MQRLFHEIKTKWLNSQSLERRLQWKSTKELADQIQSLVEELRSELDMEELNLSLKILNQATKLPTPYKKRQFTQTITTLNAEKIIRSFDIDDFNRAYSKLQELKAKGRYLSLKKISNDILTLYKSGIVKFDLDHLHVFIKILQKAVIFYPEFNKLFHKIVTEWYSLKGIDKVDILLKKNGKLPWCEMVIGDPQNEAINLDYDTSSSDMVKLINQNLCYIFRSSRMGFYDDINIQARVVTGPEPLLSEREYRCVYDAGPKINIETSGRIKIFAVGELTDQRSPSLEISVEPGFYNVIVYAFYVKTRKFLSYYICLCKTAGKEENSLLQLPEIAVPEEF